MTDGWRPLGMNQVDYDAMHEGVPPWMEMRLYAWINYEVPFSAQTTGVVGLVAEYDERARLVPPLAPQMPGNQVGDVLKYRHDDDITLGFVDFLLYRQARRGSDGSDLEGVLQRAGSAWRVGQRRGFLGLERRVPVGVQQAADAVMSVSGTAGQLLSEAWHALYGMQPNADVAYKKAILAVEAAGGQKVTPKDKVGTLGKMTTAMRDQGWKLPLVDDPVHPSSDVLWKMAKAMVAGEQGRHAANGSHTPATHEEAESAVFLAVSLVQFFHADLAAKP